MSDLIMHHYFGREVLKNINEQCKMKINNIELYDFATAGPDPFFFTSFLNKKKNAIGMGFGNYMHTHDTRKFFTELVKITKNDNKMFSYLCGFIAHYFLDSNVHPYIFYKTGVYKPDDKNTYCYRGLHTKLERAMDCYVIKKYYYHNPYKFKIAKQILKLKKLDKSYMKSFNELYDNVYNKKEGFLIVNKTIKDEKKFYKLIYDPFGIKNAIFTKLDNGTSSTSLKVLSYHGKIIDNVDIFNENHQIWFNPCDKSIKSNASFFDLFEKAKAECIKAIEAVYDVIFKNNNIDINDYFTNKSYLNGLDCDEIKPMIYFNNIFK